MAERITAPIASGLLVPRILSIPTSATIPIKPTTIPKSRRGCHTLLSPCNEVRMVDQIGTVAISNPASPEEIFFSALVMRIQGPTISAMA